MEFKMLGTLEVFHRGRNCTPSAPKVRQVLALLLARHGRIVDIESIIQDLWDEDPPRSAVTTSQTYIYQLRKMFAQELPDQSPEDLLETVAPGYVLHVKPEQLDCEVFTRLIDQARWLSAAGELEKGAQQARQALALWRGPTMSNVEHGPVLKSWRVYLEERRIGALEMLVALDMDLGRGQEMIAELHELVSAHPFNEWFHLQLITALGRAGRRGEALRAYAALRRLLADELGVDPSAEAQQVHLAMLNGESLVVPRSTARAS